MVFSQRDDAKNYVKHPLDETSPNCARSTASSARRFTFRIGRLGAQFEVLTRWKSLDAIAGFAGEPIEWAVMPESVKKMMLSYDRRVRHLADVKEGQGR